MESINATLLNIGNGLVVSRNASLVTLIEESFSWLISSSQLCMNLGACCLVLQHRKFELVVVDSGIGSDAAEVIKAVRAAPSSRGAVVIAVTWNAEQAHAAYAAGVTFVVQQPLSPASLRNLSRATQGPILRERRRYFRCYIKIPIRAFRQDRREWQGLLTNISESGACITAPFHLVPGETLTLEMQIPTVSARIVAKCEVLWADDRNRAGVHFLGLPASDKEGLQHWLTERLQRIINLERSPSVLVHVPKPSHQDAYALQEEHH